MINNERNRRRQRKIIATINEIEAGGTHGQFPLVLESAKGALVFDGLGIKYIDFTSSIFVTNCGHGYVAKVVVAQAKKLIHSYTFPTSARARLLVDLKKFLPSFCDKIFLASTGSEVTEWAIKLMRIAGTKISPNKTKIASFIGSFHGKTNEADKLSKLHVNDNNFYLPFITDDNYQQALIDFELNAKQISGIIIESYQGWSARFLNQDYVKKLVQIARENSVLICFDDIQGGFWRTGKKFAYEWYEVEPDLLCLGKGLGGGMPISALAGRATIFEVEGLSSTHSGHPVCCEAARAALMYYHYMSKDKYNKKMELFHAKIKEISDRYNLNSVYRGFLAAIIFDNEQIATAVGEKCYKGGILVVKTGRESIKLGPPLCISEAEIIKGMSILECAIQEVLSGKES